MSLLNPGPARRRIRARAWMVAAAIVGVAAAGTTVSSQAGAAADASDPIAVAVVPVALNPDNPAAASVGRFTYAGGFAVTSNQTARLHGLSDLVLSGADRLTAVGDEGVLFEARLQLDANGRLSGLTDARLAPLTGTDTKPLLDKTESDAEGVALLSNGDRLVSFERRHRIWLYPASGGAPRPVPSPAVELPNNGGLEALAADPSVAGDAYLTGAEESGDTWTCRVSAPCVKGPTITKPLEFGLVALTRLRDGRMGVLLRAWDPLRGNRIILRIQDGGTVVDEMTLARPMTVDNFEGLAAVPLSNGQLRFYILSDDNASSGQRTLLLAFDWRAP